LKHPNRFVRWSAAQGLTHFRRKDIVPAFVDALRDRSPLVRCVVVDTINSNKYFLTSAAIPSLERIVGSPTLQRRSPGLWRMAGEVLDKLRWLPLR
jgi:HEAT repeat protein